MRAIKFRVWTGMEMEYNVMVGALGVFYVQGLDPTDTACMNPNNTKYENVPVMIFTGLLDKNGKEIWEGDICTNDTKEIYEISFSDGLSAFIIQNKERWDFLGNEIESDVPEILGNIHENPELLEAK